MKKSFLFILLSLPLLMISQTTRVSGSVSEGEGQIIRLITFDDFISLKILTLAESDIAEDGSFNMEFKLEETIPAYLDINYQRAEIFLEPGGNYDLQIEYDAGNQLDSYFDQQGLVYDFREEDPKELNHLIWHFNGMYNKFVMEKFERIYTLNDKTLVPSFKEEIDSVFQEIDVKYFTDYITYKFADLEQLSRSKGRNVLAREYFVDKPILYNNVEYTFFFNEFFNKFLITSPNVITISDLIIAVNEAEDLNLIKDALDSVSYLSNPEFRELVLIHGLKGLYYNGTYKKPKVIALIKEIHNSTSYPKHMNITASLIESLTQLAPGFPTPDITLTGIGGQQFKLRSIKGKPILLNFYRAGQAGMANEMDKLAEIYNVYRAGLEVISISMDNDPSAYQSLANTGYYGWTFAHYGGDPEVFDLYDIRNLPLYVLIDVEGNIYSYPAPPPGEELERRIKKIVH